MTAASPYFEQYEPGQTRSFPGRTITEADIILHAGQTGDFFPHHMDAEWCATQDFGRRMAHGTLVMSVAIGMTARDINPHAMSYGYDRVRFIRPVFIGDTIRVMAEITGKRDYLRDPLAGLIDELVTVTNQDGIVVMTLSHLYLVQRDSIAPARTRGK